ncbi:hypothetical protein ACVWYH_006945 [Bradyrhizobium sp. GM24.11]
MPLYQRQPLFGPECQRREAGGGECFAAGYDFAIDDRVPLADHHRRHVRKRREIAGGANRALLRHQRIHTSRQHRLKLLDHRAAHAGGAAPERDDFERDHQAHDRLRRRRANAAAMRDDEVALEQRGLVGRNPLRRQLSEAGVDAIDGSSSLRGLRDDRRGRIDARPECGIEHHGCTSKHAREIVEADRSRPDDDSCALLRH